MTKYFCDVCEDEITEKNKCFNGDGASFRLGGKSGKILFEVITGFNGTWNAGCLCKYCVIGAVNSLDDRPGVAN